MRVDEENWDGRSIKHCKNKKNDICRTHAVVAIAQTSKRVHTLEA